ncbi:MAG: hypothetical protein SynsKO_38400 [Synoicihabitans sp.]
MELSLILEGAIEHQTADGNVLLSRGDCIVMPIGAVHAFGHGQASICNVYFLPEWLSAESRLLLCEHARVFSDTLEGFSPKKRKPGGWVSSLSKSDRQVVGKEIKEWSGEFARKDVSQDLLRVSLIKVLILIARSKAPPRLTVPEMMVERAIRIIEEHLLTGDQLRIEELARRLGCSTGHLHRAFQKTKGSTPYAYYMGRRVQEAAQRILEGDSPLAEIAAELGFADQAHLTRVFCSMRGITPACYRRRFAATSD